MQNLWEKDRRRLFRELYNQYLEEGYDQKEAKKLAKIEADEIISDSAEFAMDVAMKDDRDDY
jgi:hypothetical protein